MLVLGIDTSSAFLGIGLWSDEGFEVKICVDGGLTHSERLLPSLEALLRDCNLSFGDIDKVAVAIGPGSFTGIRIGVSTANAFALALKIPVVGISTLEAMAYSLRDYDGLIIATMNAQRGDFYCLFCKFDEGKLVRLADESVRSKDEILEFSGRFSQAMVLGDALKDWADMPDFLTKSEVLSPNPLVLCELGSLRRSEMEFAVPVYIRKSQAEVEYDRKNAR